MLDGGVRKAAAFCANAGFTGTLDALGCEGQDSTLESRTEQEYKIIEFRKSIAVYQHRLQTH